MADINDTVHYNRPSGGWGSLQGISEFLGKSGTPRRYRDLIAPEQDPWRDVHVLLLGKTCGSSHVRVL